MTFEEARTTLSILKAAYPSAYAKCTPAELQNILRLWAEMFSEDDSRVVLTAVKTLISSRVVGYPPTVGEVREQMYKVKQALKQDSGSESEAWAKVSKAIHNGIYGYKKEFAKLPEDIQRVVGAPEQLRQWAMMDEEAVETVVASNFQRSYRAEKGREKERSMLPEDIQRMINNALPQSETKQIGDGT